ncbi:MAG: vanadium-dependent haloperoxidase [Gemmatimonadaceae bacterium]|nr:vanadium-dependent haloperoxidase [Gloeobacterales cyanobacterium ES-bin-141]
MPEGGSEGLSRRHFLGGLGTATGILFTTLTPPARAEVITPVSVPQRRNLAYKVCVEAARIERATPPVPHPTSVDDELYSNHIGSFSKGLPHNDLGEVDPAAYQAMIDALKSGSPTSFEAIPLGGSLKLANPQLAYRYSLEGQDGWNLTLPRAFSFSSEPQAGEVVELYWQALLRDVPFADYPNHSLAQQAVEDLQRFSIFQDLTIETLFRGNTSGERIGPYVSQFLFKDVPYGARPTNQRCRVTAAGVDFMTDYAEWLQIQRGFAPTTSAAFEPDLYYLYNGRALGEYVHRDFLYQAGLDAGLILLSYGPAALDAANPYLSSVTQSGFGTFGSAHILDLLSRVANTALMACWYQKWLVHRRLRPEAFGGHLHNFLIGSASYRFNDKLLQSPVLAEINLQHGTYLLPQAYPEGCPAHPSYPAGHAAFAGASCTVLKAFFNEAFTLPDPVQPTVDGLSLEAYTGEVLTIGGELDKLAANVTIGRSLAGIHYRSDALSGLKLGEDVAITILRDLKLTYNESFSGFSLTRFDGTQITI